MFQVSSIIVYNLLFGYACAFSAFRLPASSSSSFASSNSLNSYRNDIENQPRESYDPSAFYSVNRFEGDILGTYPTKNRTSLSYHAITSDNFLWPNGELIYQIDASLENHRQLINEAMSHITSMSGNCIKFRERHEEKDYVFIHESTGCYSQVGRQGGPQELSLGRGCHVVGVVIHELLHALGFFHHHSRSDRDEFLQINYDNINPKAYPQFQKLNAWENQLFTDFDYDSIMIYGSTAFSKDGYSKTMTPLKATGSQLADPGYKFSMTKSDVVALKKLYKCEGSENGDKIGDMIGHEENVINDKNGILPTKPEVIFPPLNPDIRPIWPTGFPWPNDITTQPSVSEKPWTPSPTSKPPSTVKLPIFPQVIDHDQISEDTVFVKLPDGSLLTPPPLGGDLKNPKLPNPVPAFEGFNLPNRNLQA